MILKTELEKWRTPLELAKYVDYVVGQIEADPEETRRARSRQGAYKEFFEEVYPLSIFLIGKYGEDCSYKCRPEIGNQGYDALVETVDGQLVEVIELTWPIDGQKQKSLTDQLNKRGYTDTEVWYADDGTQRRKVVERTLKVANKKALKDYETKAGSSLVFVLNTSPEFGVGEVEYDDELMTLIQSLRELEYKVEKVFLLLLPEKTVEAIL